MSVQIIAAVDKNWGIGKNGKLLLSIPADMNFFKKITMNNVVIMGRKTLESLPAGRPLPNRENIILSHNKEYSIKDALVVHSIEEAIEKARSFGKDIFVVGGESIYRQMLPYAEIAHITYIDYSYASDVHFPNLDKDIEWEMTGESEEQTHFDICYYFRKYERLLTFPQKSID